jgi:arsenate reductase
MSDSDDIVLLHNPRCSKCRRAKEILEERGVSFVERQYLEDPLSAAELADLRQKLDRPVREWVRAKDDAFKASGLSADAPEQELLTAIASQPALMERPIVIRGDRAVVGRPPEDIERLL